jgi:cell division protein ZapA
MPEMAARPVELRVGGQSYRVVSSASAEDLERLATVVDEKLTSLVPPGKPLSPQSLLLVAMALAHDVEVERAKAERVRSHSRSALRTMLGEVEETLALADQALPRT